MQLPPPLRRVPRPRQQQSHQVAKLKPPPSGRLARWFRTCGQSLLVFMHTALSAAVNLAYHTSLCKRTWSLMHTHLLTTGAWHGIIPATSGGNLRLLSTKRYLLVTVIRDGPWHRRRVNHYHQIRWRSFQSWGERMCAAVWCIFAYVRVPLKPQTKPAQRQKGSLCL